MQSHESNTVSQRGSLQHWAITAVLIAAAFAFGSRTGFVSEVASSQDQGAAATEEPKKETVIVQQISPPAIAIDATNPKGGARCVAIVGGADGRYWLVGDDGLAVCVHDGRNDLFWWNEQLTAQTILQR